MHASVLKYFVEVARCGSVRKASETLHVAASAVNRQILKLEEELGVALFDRLPNGMRLNRPASGCCGTSSRRCTTSRWCAPRSTRSRAIAAAMSR